MVSRRTWDTTEWYFRAIQSGTDVNFLQSARLPYPNWYPQEWQPDEYRNAYRVFRGAHDICDHSRWYCSTAIVFFGAGFIATDIMKMSICPSMHSAYWHHVFWLLRFLGVFRGFFQGFGSMIPTAVSQICRADHQCGRQYRWRLHVIKGWTEFRIRSRQEVIPLTEQLTAAAGGNIGNGCRCSRLPWCL